MATSIWRSGSFFTIVVMHVVICPYTKVEESFNIQAIHDVLYSKWNIEEYDHKNFPGVVPRTFIGALVVGLVSSPINAASSLFKANKDTSQYIVRIILGCLVMMSFAIYRRAVAKVLSHSVANLLAMITLTQFHFMFYSSRTLPNTFALMLVLPALGFWLENKVRKFIWLSAFTAVIFRAELCLLVGPLLLLSLSSRRVGLVTAIKHAVLSGIAALAFTISIDSIFWGQLLWPEGVVLYYNTVLNKSSNWGTLPFLWYFYSAIPRCLLLFLPFVPLGITSMSKNFVGLFVSTLLFVFLYSFLPHKELRFIIYAIPVLNTSAAIGILQILLWVRKRNVVSKLMYIMVAGLLFGNIVATGFLSYVSHHNYPGGVALSKLHQVVETTRNVSVHIDNFAAQTGVTRFGELNSNWRYSKEEHLDVQSPKLHTFTHLIRETPCSAFSHTHSTISMIKGFHRINLDFRSLRNFIQIDTVEKLCLLERKDISKINIT